MKNEITTQQDLLDILSALADGRKPHKKPLVFFQPEGKITGKEYFEGMHEKIIYAETTQESYDGTKIDRHFLDDEMPLIKKLTPEKILELYWKQPLELRNAINPEEIKIFGTSGETE